MEVSQASRIQESMLFAVLVSRALWESETARSASSRNDRNDSVISMGGGKRKLGDFIITLNKTVAGNEVK